MWKCPYCHEEITYLKYSVPTTAGESGTASLYRTDNNENEIDDHDSEDSWTNEWDGSPEYSCPECGGNFDNLNIIEYSPEEEDEDNDEEKETLKEKTEKILEKIKAPKNIIIKPKHNITENGNLDSLGSNIICKECHHIYVCRTKDNRFSSSSEEIRSCPKCGESNSEHEFKKLLEEGFFNKKIKPKKNVKQNTQPRPITSLGKSRRKIHSKI